jgi:hypothetical protein
VSTDLIISVISRARQSGERARQVALDVEREPDNEAALFFNEALELNAQLYLAG